MQFNDDSMVRIVSIVVSPVKEPASMRGMMIVLFDEKMTESKGSNKDSKVGVLKEADPRVTALEQELQTTKEYLHTTIEELKSTNEELQSTNEEMETSKEELHSTNEEFETVNSELQSKVNKLSTVNNDLNNMLSAQRSPPSFLIPMPA